MSISFSEEIKKEILEGDLPKGECCRRAMAYGLLACADITPDGSIVISAANGEEAQRIAGFLRSRMACNVEQSDYRRGRVSRVLLRVTLRKRAEWMERFLDDDFDAQLAYLFPCPHCRQSFVRGAFVAQGTVSDPTRELHLEISCGSDTVAQRLESILCELGCPPKNVLRHNGQHLYYKNGSAVEDFLTLLNANKALFTLINAKIEREIRNNANRAANCETRNIQKAIVASAKQTDAIRLLRDSELWEGLPEQLRTTAQLRLEHPDATLSELALLHEPVITKSGLNHRLQKLTEIAKEIQPKVE
ncbi:MAG: DNA-binding protein WhiA [Clostridia bacterium]|nr:DNA-binding protein WhiA [Clostridia bacterium]